MSYFPELLIEAYEALIQNARDCNISSDLAYEAKKEPSADEQERLTNSSAEVSALASKRALKMAERIRKRMTSLGYHDCWKESVDWEVEVP